MSKGSAGHEKVDHDPGHKRKRNALLELVKTGPVIPLIEKALKEPFKDYNVLESDGRQHGI